MDDKVNYALVGAFVLGLGAALVAAVLWLAAGLGGGREMDRYQAVIRESVAGLNVDAPVKYLGVDVGKVSRIEIDPHNSQQVRLHFLIERGTPIQQDSAAVLKTQGLTGIAYIELSGGSAGSPPLRPGADGAAPTIPFKLSLGARLENVLTNVLANVDRVSNNLNAVFDTGNQRALRSTLADTAALAHALAGQKGA
ncbi:MAG: MCE family protein, partial [Burkholderiales bacterium]|nr:MCE family protein [Burkholderiales bacterium]